MHFSCIKPFNHRKCGCSGACAASTRTLRGEGSSSRLLAVLLFLHRAGPSRVSMSTHSLPLFTTPRTVPRPGSLRSLPILRQTSSGDSSRASSDTISASSTAGSSVSSKDPPCRRGRTWFARDLTRLAAWADLQPIDIPDHFRHTASGRRPLTVSTAELRAAELARGLVADDGRDPAHRRFISIGDAIRNLLEDRKSVV